MAHQIFISYSRKDKIIVDNIVCRLEAEGYSVWIDRTGIKSGDAFKKELVYAIESSSALLYFSSKDSNASTWTAKEIGVAVYENIPIIPIRLDDAKYNPEVKFDLINIDFIDYTTFINFDEFFACLNLALSKYISQQNSIEDCNDVAFPIREAHNDISDISHDLEIGVLHYVNGTLGIVVELDDSKRHGKLMSIVQTELPFLTISTSFSNSANDMNDGIKNCNIIKSNPEWRKLLPALSWCSDLGKDWYLPAINELSQILSNSNIKDLLNNSLSHISSPLLADVNSGAKYCSSTEYNIIPNWVWYYSVRRQAAYYGTKDDVYYVRAMAKF